MDKSWINIKNRLDPLYENGATNFLHFSSLDRPNASEILCPCRKCRNMKFVRKDLIVEHIVVDGFLTSYTSWIFHGEKSSSPICVDQLDKGDEMQDMLHEAFGIPPTSSFVDMDTSGTDGLGSSNQHNRGVDKKTGEFFKLLKEVERELYPGSKYSLLSFLVRLLHLKCLNGWSNNSFSMLLELLKDVFPEGETLPKSFNDSKKIIKDLGLEYKKIHACPNDCMIYWNDTEDQINCKICKAPRYKQFKGESIDNSSKSSKIPAKVFRYFPLIPRLQRLFMSTKTSTEMRWHAEGRTKDGVMRHPADSIAWRNFDETHVDFAQDPRNVRLGLASDGFSPFKSMSISHSTWPVILIPYNLPPWLCMKQPYMILSMIIDGPRAPGNDIDVYLRPLVDELKELWIGVSTYDASNNHMFQMRASLLWTISDFPALGNLSGYGVKTRYACPCCLNKTKFRRLKNGQKYCFMSHRRWLPHGHKFRKDKVTFDGLAELEVAPKRLSGIEILKQMKNIRNKFGKDPLAKSRKRKWGDADDVGNVLENIWNKRSIFFELEYWKDNMMRHNLDTMHIEKNVFDNIFWTLLNVDGKCKDNLKSRLDLQEMRIQKALHPKKKANGKYYLPPACFTLSNKQKDMLLQVLRDVNVPDGYSSNISNCVDLKQRTMHGLKSHDCHVLMQQLLPIALRNLVPINVLKPLIELSNFFRGISSTVMKIGELEKLQDRVAITLCHLERIFPPFFFDIMEHLVIHLAEEAMLGGPSQYRSMWAIERFLLSLKNFVRSRSHPEGCIAEGQWIQEIMTFCSRYLDDVETKSNRPLRNNILSNETMDLEGRRSSKEKGFILDDITHAQAHRHVLFNSASTTPYREEHIKEIKKGNPRLSRHDVDRIHNERFQIWFRNHVEKMHLAGEQIPQDIQHLAVGPSKQAKRMTGYICNGVRYLTKSRDAKRKTQNSGIMVKATTQSYASARDKNPILADVSFYGILTDIIELYYTKKFKFVLFTCKWVNNNKGLIEKDDYGFTLVNFNHLLYTKQHLSNEPFIFASQAQQIFYVDHPMENEWQIVVKFKPRGFYDLGEDTPSIEHKKGHMELWPEQQLDDTTFESEDDIEWVRHGVPGIEIDPQTLECNEAFDEDDDTS